MTFREQVAAAKQQSHWTSKQRNHLRRMLKIGATIAYWNSDRHGRPANHDMDPIAAREWTARPGLVQTVKGPLMPCSGQALHATFEPHRWKGERVWVVALVGTVATHGGNKVCSLRREVIGEVLPEEVVCASVGIRIGRRDLVRANLYGANLVGANLYGANLYGANLYGANLVRANLDGANLYGANLVGANLYGANLYGANLVGANLDGANLVGANLVGAKIQTSASPPSGWTIGDKASCGCCAYLKRSP
jgi:hypothetical protein